MSKLPKATAEYEAKLRALRAALKIGEESGPPTAFDFNVFIRRKRRSSRVRTS